MPDPGTVIRETSLPGFDPGTTTPSIHWNYIPGHSATIDRIYAQATQEMSDGDKVVEIGVMYGRSLAILEAQQRHHKKRFDVYGICVLGYGCAASGART